MFIICIDLSTTHLLILNWAVYKNFKMSLRRLDILLLSLRFLHLKVNLL